MQLKATSISDLTTMDICQSMAINVILLVFKCPLVNTNSFWQVTGF